jgi:hypothetical protein
MIKSPLPQVLEGFLESSLVKASWAGTFSPFRLTPCRFGEGKNLLGGDEKVDVVKVVALG